jgi:uncharacterized membrane protein SirB2
MFSLIVLHQSLAVISVSGFVLRGIGMWRDSPWLAARVTRVAPHIVDTLLLVTGVWLAWRLPAAALAGWLPAKLAALLVYIGFGWLALRPGRPKAVRRACFVAALLAVAYLAGVALTRRAIPLLG